MPFIPLYLAIFLSTIFESNSDKVFDYFGRKTTAHQIYLDTNAFLKGSLAIVTGSTSGLGKETVRILAMTYCTVIMASRNAEKNEAVKQELIDIISNDDKSRLTSRTILAQNLVPMTLDLASLQSISDFATAIYTKYPQPIDILVNNAGVVLPEYTLTTNGFEKQFGVNHLGHYYLTRLLINKLTQVRSASEKTKARIITVSSRAHSSWAPYPITNEINNHLPPVAARYNHRKNYGISKMCNILFGRELQRRFGSKGLISMSLHPGIIKTEIQRHFPDVLEDQYPKNIEQGTATQIFCALIPEAQLVGGGYYDDCNLRNDRLRKDVKEPEGFFDDGFDVTNTNEYKLWEFSEKLILDKGFGFEITEKLSKTDL